METMNPSMLRRLARSVSSAQVLLPLGFLALTMLAMPFYGRVMENIFWMGESLSALCGFGG